MSVFHVFQNCTNGTKLPNASHMDNARYSLELCPYPGFILTNYSVWYTHAAPFLRNEMPFSLLNSKNICSLGGVAF